MTTYAIPAILNINKQCDKNLLEAIIGLLAWRNIKRKNLILVDEFVSDEFVKKIFSQLQFDVPYLFFHVVLKMEVPFLLACDEYRPQEITHYIKTNACPEATCLRSSFSIGNARHFILDYDFVEADIEPLLKIING